MVSFSLELDRLINVTPNELDELVARTFLKTFNKYDVLISSGHVPNSVFFIESGLVHALVEQKDRSERTVHFFPETSFAVDYTSFSFEQPTCYILQAVEKTEVRVLTRSVVEWAYAHLKEGETLKRLMAEYFAHRFDQRVRKHNLGTPKQRYKTLTEIVPRVHERVPPPTVASYLGIDPLRINDFKSNVSGLKISTDVRE